MIYTEMDDRTGVISEPPDALKNAGYRMKKSLQQSGRVKVRTGAVEENTEGEQHGI